MKSRGRGPAGRAAAGRPWPAAVRVWPVRHARAWPLWALPPWLLAFVITVVILDAAGLGFAASHPVGGLHDLILFALLMACDIGSLELTRRAGEKAGISRDMHAVWELPVALLLPLVYAPVVPIIRLALTQWRVRRAPLHRRVFSASALGLSYLAAGLVFRFLGTRLAGLIPFGRPDSLATSPFRHGFAWMLVAAAACAVQCVINVGLVCTAARGADRSIRLREAQFSREPLYNDAAELCLAVLVAFGVASSPIALLFAFPFAALPLRAVRHAQLVTDSRTDSKTGLLNARAWEQEAVAALARAVHVSKPLAVAVLDLDWFKLVNDTYGHLFGDEVLRQIGLCLPSALRDYDLAGRFGGEEFVLLLPYTRAVDAFRVADRVRGRIAALPLRAPGGEAVQVTASVGVAALEGGSRRELTELMAAADAALYRAKRCGRNQVQMLSPSRGLSATSGLSEAFNDGGLDGLARRMLPTQPGPPEMTTRSR
ncbi:MAG TPA: GGDEF domain-containing protein [Streptosporangiaceae bacterium]|nr:GGDEF domain-containing protein [Streptosporangiaceae bacterium]